MSAVETFQARLDIERDLYALHLLAWSRNPVGTPLTFDEWLAMRETNLTGRRVS